MGWSWAPDGTQPFGGEDALRALPVDPLPPDASARRPGDVVIPAVPLGGDPRLAADAVTRWMADDRARATPPAAPVSEGAVRSAQRSEGAPRSRTPARPPAAPVSEGAVRSTQWSEGAPRSTTTPGARKAIAWLPVVVLAVMVIVIVLVTLTGGG